MITYLPPTPPDFDRIINEELAKIRDYSYIQDSHTRTELEKTNPLYKNTIHNNAEIESFETAVQARLLVEKENYLYHLEEYKRKLEAQKADIEEKIEKKKKELSQKENDFNLAKKFYEDFQKLVNSKIHLIQQTAKEIITQKDKENSREKVE